LIQNPEHYVSEEIFPLQIRKALSQTNDAGENRVDGTISNLKSQERRLKVE